MAAVDDRELHLSDRRWRVFVCMYCHPDYADLPGATRPGEYDVPYLVVMEEGKRARFLPRCDDVWNELEEHVLVTLTPVESQRY